MPHKQLYPWEEGNKLSLEIQAGKAQEAKQTLFQLLDIVDKIHHDDFSKVKLRAIQIATLLIRGVYNAQADPDILMEKNIEFINWIHQSSSLEKLKEILNKIVDEAVKLVPEKNYYNNKRLIQAVSVIQKNIDRSVSRKEIAQKIGVSETYVSKFFFKTTGCTFKEFSLKIKVKKAQSMLLNGKDSISEIAFKLGFHDPNYFSTVFRRIMGVSPGQYRNKIKKN